MNEKTKEIQNIRTLRLCITHNLKKITFSQNWVFLLSLLK